MTTNVMRYTPAKDKRKDRVKRGRCGRVWCYEIARWIRLDAVGKQHYLCQGHRP